MQENQVKMQENAGRVNTQSAFKCEKYQYSVFKKANVKVKILL